MWLIFELVRCEGIWEGAHHTLTRSCSKKRLLAIRPSSIVSVLNSPVGVVIMLRSRDPVWLAFNARRGYGYR